MNMVELIVKKRNGLPLSKEEIFYIVQGYVSDEIPDYQMSAWLMAVFFQGMNEEETVELTRVMMDSGELMDLSGIHGRVVDKHSTGGVGDTTTMILAPWLAACGVPVAKMSGRGLGHTGGTIDKMESIPGFRTGLTMEEFISHINHVGVALAGQTGSIAPADKKIYALRDVTGTVEEPSLIASSIMSKKLASGAQAILLDVKTGAGAFMETKEEAVALAKTMVDIGSAMGRETKAVISAMDQPLGNAIGNAIEVLEAIRVLQGKEKGDLYRLSLLLAQEMMILAEPKTSRAQARARLLEVLESGDAFKKWLEFVHGQGGNLESVVDGSTLGRFQESLKADREGFVQSVDAQTVGLAAMHLGAGRQKKDEVIDLGAGIRLLRRIGDPVKVGDPLAQIYANDEDKISGAMAELKKAFVLGMEKIQPPALVLGYVDKNGVELFNETDHRDNL
jgi:pyrimidine-nucleoside phosphorylase